MTASRLAPAAVLLAGVLLTGCSGGASEVAAPPAASAAGAAAVASTRPTPATCPSGAPTQAWPAGVPAELPVPPTAAMGQTTRTKDGLTVLRFVTTQSLPQGVVFLTKALQPAGFTLGRGDAEATEADVPFSRGTLRGVLKMIAEKPCRTQWVLALQARPLVLPAATLPPLLPRYTTGSPSPLPFG